MKTEYKPSVYIFASLVEAGSALADYILESCISEIKDKGYFTIVLSGGSTPHLLYEKLGSAPYVDRIPWDKTYIFWGDERCVPMDHEYSNFRMVDSLLLDRIDIPAGNVYRMPTDCADGSRAASLYEKAIADFFEARGRRKVPGKNFPEFDLLLQGMGSDGHTASLFPGDGALQEKEKWVVAVSAPALKPQVPRLTLSMPVLNQGKRVVFLISGAEKKKLFDGFLSDHEGSVKRYPAARVNPAGELHWFVAEGQG